MVLRRLFQRKPAAPDPSVTSQVRETAQKMSRSSERAPLSEEQAVDLREAWAELSEAAQQSKVLNFHACTRTGQTWTEDPDSIRALAAILRGLPKDGQQTT
jgi:hypothetical protein